MAKKYQVIGTPFENNFEEVKAALETRMEEIETALDEKVEQAVNNVFGSSSGSGEDINSEIKSWF